jgi:hypothetical protein
MMAAMITVRGNAQTQACANLLLLRHTGPATPTTKSGVVRAGVPLEPPLCLAMYSKGWVCLSRVSSPVVCWWVGGG